MSKIKIGKPTGAKSVNGYQALPQANSELPTAAEWQRLTNGGRSTQEILNRIHELLGYYHGSTGKDLGPSWNRLAILGELYFLADYWLKRASKMQDDPAYAHRKPTVESFYVTVVDKLCKCFDCTPNFLPNALEECWGRALTPHGYHLDTQPDVNGKPVAVYLTRAEAEAHRLRFQNGLCYMRNRSNASQWVPAESKNVGWTYHPSVKEQMMDPGYAGFALSMGRDLYMAHHRGCFHSENFFHSSYLAGNAVLCTGTILVQAGVVRAIRNDSGHYQPTLENLVNVAQTLSMHGVDLKNVLVRAVPHSWKDVNGVVQTKELRISAHDLIAQRGYGIGLHNRMTANEKQIGDRHGQKAARLRTLPPPPVSV